jgi:hypothetical protein
MGVLMIARFLLWWNGLDQNAKNLNVEMAVLLAFVVVVCILSTLVVMAFGMGET